MNTSQLNKVNELLTVGIPKKDREMRAHLGNVVYIEPRHVMMARTTMTEGMQPPEYRQFQGTEERAVNGDLLKFVREHNKRVVVDRKFLIEILRAMDCDNVIIYADEDCPIGIVGMMAQEMKVEGVIAPRVYETSVEEAMFYD